MKNRTFGRTGLSVSEIGHGLWGMGSWSGSSEEQSLAALAESRRLGCNFYDSAWAYGAGKSDRLLGQAGKSGGAGTVLASKIPPKNWKWPAQGSLQDVFPLEHVLDYAGRIRAATGLDTIDLIQLHVWNDDWLEDAAFARTVEALKKRGHCRHFGISINDGQPWNGVKAVKSGLVDSVQVIYNIFEQSPEDELFPACSENNVGVIARVPLDEGSLGGKMTLDSSFPKDDWRANYFTPAYLAQAIPRVERLKQLVPAGMSLPEMALRFVLGQPAVSTVIVGMRSLANIRANFDAAAAGPLDSGLQSELRKHRWDR
jgi:aryl-alcohol dehydrogenase-like predicted oxidoreductase